MTETIVPSSSRKAKASRLTVELYADGQHDDRRQEAEPHKQEAWRGRRRGRGAKELTQDSYMIKARRELRGGTTR